MNVPPAPAPVYASAIGLGDPQLSYRIYGLILQNLGDSGGKSRALSEYNYDDLGHWFFLEDSLDQRSNFIPYLASYYFGAVQTPESLRPLIHYLIEIGQRPEEGKWRWLGQAVFLARFRLQDYDLALEAAQKLSAVKGADIPVWAKNMEGIVLNAKGEKDAAFQIMIQTLQTERDKMEQSEVLFMIDYICNQILDEENAAMHDFCSEVDQ